MSTRLNMIAGEDKTWPLQCFNEGSLTTPVFGPNDAMTAVISPGEGQAALFAPAVAWWTNPDPVTGIATQAGYTQAQVIVTVAAADSATLEPEAVYALEVWRQPAVTTTKYCVWRGQLVAGYSAGTGVTRWPTYCRYKDMLEFGPWVRYLPDAAGDEAAFYSKRLEARNWIDDLIVRSDNRGGLFPFGTAGTPYWMWSGWMAARKTPMPSVWIRDQLWGGFVRWVTVTNAGFGYMTPPVVTAPAPPFSPVAGLAPRQQAATFFAVLNGAGGLGSVLVSNPGFGYPPGTPVPLTVSGGGGFGATAVADVSPGALLRRDQLRRITAYKALSLVGLAQVGNNPQHVALGEWCGQKVSEELCNYVAELDINFDGWPDIPIFLGNTATIYR